ncbi:MAG: hypothetical protein K1X57_10315 [Gemmataceae bacterium]|nr:hypothetical protein [Gemmataceae bacterium]
MIRLLLRRWLSGPARSRSHRRPRIGLQRLESREVPATFTVSNLSDLAIAGSLRQAVIDANSNGVGADTINFAIPGGGTIALGSEIVITGSLSIDGPSALDITISGSGSRLFTVFDGGSLLDVSIDELVLSNGNASFGGGGAIRNDGELLTITNCRFTNNLAGAGRGGAIFTTSTGQLTVLNSTFSGNKAATGVGGAIAAVSSTVSLDSCLFQSNQASGSGGGIDLDASKLTMTASRILNNKAANGGGLAFQGSLGGGVIRGSIVSGNTAAALGGGVAVYLGTSQLAIQNCTLTGNSAVVAGGLSMDQIYGGTVAVDGTLISGNSATGNADIRNTTGTLNVTKSAYSQAMGITNSVNNVVATFGQLKLGPLTNNGGPFDTYRPANDSPLIDAGSNSGNLTTDIRGVTRVWGLAADIGAVEAPVTAAVINTSDTGPGSLRQWIADANTDRIGGANSPSTITFDPALFGTDQTITLTTGTLAITDDLDLRSDNPSFTTIKNTLAGHRVFDTTGASAGTSIAMFNLRITGGQVVGSGGGILVDDENLSLATCEISANSASGDGGGIAVTSAGGHKVSLAVSYVLDNVAGGSGGGIHFAGAGELNISGTRVAGNSANTGGGLFITGATYAPVAASTIVNNSAAADGGGIASVGAATLLYASTVSGNQAVGAGGGLHLDGPISGTNIRISTIAGNSAGGPGGGVALAGLTGSLAIQNSTIATNSSGGVAVLSGAGASVAIESTIVAGNGADDISTVGVPVTVKASAFQNAVGTTDLGGNVVGPFANLLLGPLADNGGATLTMLPGKFSPLLDVGVNPTPTISLDQRESPRVWNLFVDIGAVERATDLLVRNTNDAGPDSLRQAILDANALPGAQTIGFDTNVFATAKTILLTTGEMAVNELVTIDGPGSDLVTIDANLQSRIFNIGGPGLIDVTIEGVTLTRGKATGNGGAVLSVGENLTLQGCVLTQNSASNLGGAIAVEAGGLLTVIDSRVANNVATIGGGFVGIGGAVVIRSTVAGNTANLIGGFGVLESLLVESCTVSGNKAISGNGGGIQLENTFASPAIIRNSTIAGNSAATLGGGICLVTFFTGTLSIQNCTIVNNTATTEGGGILRSGTFGTSAISLASTVISNNSSPVGPDISSQVPTSLADCLLGSASGIDTPVFSGASLALLGLDPQLGPLRDNGGPTSTMMPAVTSPLIGSGSNPDGLTTDQRGFDRVVGSIEIGATEVQSLVVTNAANAGPGSLRRALDEANTVAGAQSVTFDPVFFAVPRTITLTSGPLSIADAVVVDGPGAARATIDGDLKSRVLAVDAAPASPVTIRGLTITRGSATVEVGGGIYVRSGTVTIDRCVVSNNSASQGGGIGGDFLLTTPITILDTRIAGNRASSFGGGVFTQAGLVVRRSEVSSNTCDFASGGIYVERSLILESSLITGNTCGSNNPGGLTAFNLLSDAVIDDCTATFNTGVFGSAFGIFQLFVPARTLTISNCLILNNTATSAGGGLALQNLNVVLTNSVVQDNRAGERAGGIWVQNGTLVVRSSSITGNSAATAQPAIGGGGMFLYQVSPTLIENTTIASNTTIFAGNTTHGSGGGILSVAGPGGTAMTIRNSTIVGNSAVDSGGLGVVNSAGPATLQLESTVIAGNSAIPSKLPLSDLATIGLIPVSGANNFIGVNDPGTNMTFGPGNLIGTASSPIDPMLDALKNNGGRTLTMRPLPGSPLINAGSNSGGLTTDQRGQPRLSGPTVDIGAYETQPAARVASVVVGDGTNQRSTVRQLVVTFEAPVTFAGSPADAFTLRRQSDNATVDLAVAMDPTGTTATITFTGGPTQFGSLADGRYTLGILASQLNGDGLDGDGNGTGGDDYTLVGNPATAPRLFRLLGDADGNGQVTSSDFLAFRLAFLSPNPTFDFDNSGTVSSSDFLAFRLNFLKTI